MQSMQRQFGKLMKRSPDDSQISVLLKDFDDADKLLTRVQSIAPHFHGGFYQKDADIYMCASYKDYRLDQSLARRLVLDLNLSMSIG